MEHRLAGMHVPVSADALQQMSSEIIVEPEDLCEMTFGVISKHAANRVHQILGIGRLGIVALHDGTKMLGGAMIMMPKDCPLPPADVLKIFAHVAAVAMQRRQAEAQIRSSLAEKEVLLQEIHHRVKNNLQVISSLLNLQAHSIEDGQIQEIFKDSQNRIRSMSLIHEKLYSSQNLDQIDFGDYARDLALFLFHFYQAESRALNLTVQTDSALLDIDIAVPCGLILNELATNALKHAFVDGRSGEIRIEFRNTSDGYLRLIVQDNGIGFPQNLDFRNSTSLGLQLVDTLVRQINGSIGLRHDIGSNNGIGTRFEVTFTPS
jgi:two-component sensor histidine kinase